MSNADETLDNIKRENRLNPDDRVTFLLDEIKYRDSSLEWFLDWFDAYCEDKLELIPDFVKDLNKEYQRYEWE